MSWNSENLSPPPVLRGRARVGVSRGARRLAPTPSLPRSTGGGGFLILLATVLALQQFSAGAMTYYVSPAGNDVGPGVRAAPWQTLQRAARSLQPGDTVYVFKGDYAGFVLGWDTPVTGTPAAPITFKAETGATIVSRNNKTPDGIDLEPGCSDIVIDGFTVNNSDGSIRRAGIRICGSDRVHVINNDCENNGTWGIFGSHDNDLLIENNITANSVRQHGIYVSNSADHPIVRGNTIFGNAQCGIHLNGDASQGGNGLITGAIIENNIIHDNGKSGGAAINCDGVVDSVFRCNLLYENHSSGFAIFHEDGAHGSTGNIIVNNTIVMASDARWAININAQSTNNTLCNNIILNENSDRGSITVSGDSLEGLISDYNILQPRFSLDDDDLGGIAAWRRRSGLDWHSTVALAESIFVDPAGHDYHLKCPGPAIAAGNATPAKDRLPKVDLAGHALIGSPDLGAYQFAEKP